jgi:hypothetical protein
VLYTQLAEVQRTGQIRVPTPRAAQVGRIDLDDSRAYARDYNDATLSCRIMRGAGERVGHRDLLLAQDSEQDETLVSHLMEQVAKRVVKETSRTSSE